MLKRSQSLAFIPCTTLFLVLYTTDSNSLGQIIAQEFVALRFNWRNFCVSCYIWRNKLFWKVYAYYTWDLVYLSLYFIDKKSCFINSVTTYTKTAITTVYYIKCLYKQDHSWLTNSKESGTCFKGRQIVGYLGEHYTQIIHDFTDVYLCDK